MAYRELPKSPEVILYHVFSRGNEKRPIFFDQADYQRFLTKLALYQEVVNVPVHGYCLMPNHYQLILEHNDFMPITSFMRRLLTGHAMYINRKYDRVGHLFSRQFAAKPIDSDHYLLQISAYIHTNPYKLDQDIEQYQWSSLQFYIDKKLDTFVKKDRILEYCEGQDMNMGYRAYVRRYLKNNITHQPTVQLVE